MFAFAERKTGKVNAACLAGGPPANLVLAGLLHLVSENFHCLAESIVVGLRYSRLCPAVQKAHLVNLDVEGKARLAKKVVSL